MVLWYIKHYITFSLHGFYARLDGIEPIPQTKCLVRVHAPSDFWRDLDPGYYRFVHKYVFLEVRRLGNGHPAMSFAGAAFAKAFAIAWRGMRGHVFLWGAQMLSVATAEVVLKKAARSGAMRPVRARFSQAALKRMRMAAIAPAFCVHVLATHYFFSSVAGGALLRGVFLRARAADLAWLWALVYAFVVVGQHAYHEEYRQQLKEVEVWLSLSLSLLLFLLTLIHSSNLKLTKLHFSRLKRRS